MRRYAMAASLALMVSFAQSMQATVARAVSFDEKVESAETIVLGRCIHQHSALDPSGRWIVTYSTFQVSKTYKGNAVSEVTVVTPGGELHGLHQETIGVPTFSEGDLNVIFIRGSKQMGPTVLYMDQGAYRVFEQGNGQIVAPVESGLVLMDPQTGKALSNHDEGARSLSEFERQLSRRIGGEVNR